MPDNQKIQAALAAAFVTLAAAFILLPLPTYYSGGLAGHVAGIIGSVLMALTLIYPFRKRVLGKKGKKNPLDPHIFYGLAGPILVVVHSGHRFEGLTANLTYGAMLLVVLSGIAGRYLYRRVNRGVKQQKTDLASLQGLLAARRREIDGAELQKYISLASDDHSLQADEDGADDATIRKYHQLREISLSIAEKEQQIATYDATKSVFTKWLRAHIYITVFMFAMMIVHVLVTLRYGLRWLP